MGISFLYIIAKPILKIIENIKWSTINENNDVHISFIKYAYNSIFKIWTCRWTKSHTKIERDDIRIPHWWKTIHFRRIFKSTDLRSCMPSLSKHPDQRKCKLNHPRLIELLSNAAFHEAEELVKDNNNHKIHKS